jgi:hypothetical protein
MPWTTRDEKKEKGKRNRAKEYPSFVYFALVVFIDSAPSADS